MDENREKDVEVAAPAFISRLPSCVWPAVPNDAGAQAIALQYQLEHSQWLAPAALERAQFAQLRALFDEAARHIPYWRDALAAAGWRPGDTPDRALLARLPVLDRRGIQQHAEALVNPRLRGIHGQVREAHTSGSTGTPVRFLRTDLTSHFWRAFTLREHLWQRRDFSGTLAAIRSNIEDGRSANWGQATENLIATGPASLLNIRADIDAQLDWLAAENPHYLLTHPSNLNALARRALERGVGLPRLRQVRTFGEILGADTVALCRRAWNAGIADVYSSEEAGYIASQCERGRYHVQAEGVLVEIVDDAGHACAAGVSGRVLVTTLQNFAMPLIRYDIGDYAAFGEPCPCGRGLPVFAHIHGRKRNMLHLPDGTTHWPSFPEERWVGLAPLTQVQVVQKALDHVVLRVCATRTLEAGERAQLVATFQDTLRFPHRISIDEVAAIPRAANAKFEDFVSEIA